MGFTWDMGIGWGWGWVSHLAEAALCSLVSVCDHAISAEGMFLSFSAQPSSLLRAGPCCLVHTLALQEDTWLLLLPLGATVLGFDRG